MAIAPKQTQKPLLPPDEKFWQRYSAHHELPLAGMTSIFIHGLIIGVMMLAAFWYLFQRGSETNKPPSMDMVQLSGGGDGFEGAGGAPGLPGDAKQTEIDLKPVTNATETLPEIGTNLKEAPMVELNIPEISSAEAKADVESMLSNLEKEAAAQANKKAAPPKKAAKIAMSGTGNPKGVGGQGGSGGGPGRGNKGTGLGVGGAGGNKSKAEIYASRWHFELTGIGKDHVAKYMAIGAAIAIRAPNGQFLFLRDLRRRPVDLQPGILPDFKNVVMWQNTDELSLSLLAGELRLPFVPALVVMFLPKEREEKMAQVEMRFAQQMGRDPKQIQKTWFDFRLRDGVYEPVAIRQQ